jgi:DNA-binding CsgD family transcriptional regulator
MAVENIRAPAEARDERKAERIRLRIERIRRIGPDPRKRGRSARPVIVRQRPKLPPSPRESEVLSLLAKELNTAEIATALGIRPRTVKFHFKNLFEKSGTKSRMSLLLWHLRRANGEKHLFDSSRLDDRGVRPA